ncbi:MAG TPA: NADH-quinone oxidoreductase subunit N [Methanomassiliicoccales archaeon]|nr:NADH-quinone oxidoreductase subunit N [Methanomassiliicoccales archaeon]
MADYTAIMPLIVLAVFGVLAPAVRIIGKSDKATAIWALVGVLISGSLVADFYLTYPYGSAVDFEGVIVLNYFSALFMLLFLSVAAYVIIASFRYVDKEKHTGEYYALILMATTGMMIVAGALDLITLFVGIELTSLSSYALVAFRKTSKRGSEAATKYFIIGGLSSAIGLFGISLLYGVTAQFPEVIVGSNPMTFENIGAAVSAAMGTPAEPMVLLAAVMIIAGFGFKIALVPFHMWAPDVYEGAPTTITAMLAGGSKKMGIIALFKVFLIGLIAMKTDWTLLIGVIAILTMTVGNVIAVSQTSLKRMLAYSSIAQAGYILIALPVAAVSDPNVAVYGLAGGFFHMITHAFMKGGAFLIVAALSTVAVGENVADYKGLAKRAPWVAFAMMIMLFSLAGIPPLAGFWSKYVLFSGAIDAWQFDSQNNWYLWLAIAGILNSAFSLYYYARVVKNMYVEKGPTDKVRVPTAMAVAIAICFVAVIGIGLYPQPIIQACTDAAHAFLGV